jgi:hypothetical protein
MSVIDTLITGRTQSDIQYRSELRERYINRTATPAEIAEWVAGLKGAYNASDLNRVESAVAYLVGRFNDLPGELADYLNSLGVAPDALFDVPYSHPISLTVKLDWAVADIPLNTQMERYISNINAIRSIITIPAEAPATPPDVQGLTVTEANDIEAILKAVDDATLALEALKKSYADLTADAWRYCGTLNCGQGVILP